MFSKDFLSVFMRGFSLVFLAMSMSGFNNRVVLASLSELGSVFPSSTSGRVCGGYYFFKGVIEFITEAMWNWWIPFLESSKNFLY